MPTCSVISQWSTDRLHATCLLDVNFDCGLQWYKSLPTHGLHHHKNTTLNRNKKSFKTCCRMILAIIFLRQELCFAMQKFIQSLSKASQHVMNKENSFSTVESPFWSSQNQICIRGRRPYPNFMPLFTATFLAALKEKYSLLICKSVEMQCNIYITPVYQCFCGYGWQTYEMQQ